MFVVFGIMERLANKCERQIATWLAFCIGAEPASRLSYSQVDAFCIAWSE